MKKTMLTGALILTAGLGTGLAQESRTMTYHRVETVTGSGPDHVMAAGPLVTAGPGTFFFENFEMALDGAVVKGAPYAAEATTETTQTLSDGNRIHRTTKATLYRDGEGRTRREQTLGEVGPLMASGEPIQTIVISDPVAGTTYMLNSREKVAHKLPGRGDFMMHAGEMSAKVKAEVEHSKSGASGVQGFAMRVRHGGGETDRDNIKKESLGTQMMEGVAAEGTRTTMTIPAGAVGNERPIEVVTESWYSNQLHTTVMTKTTDPRMGETVYTLKGIKLVEPSPSLFAVPADYAVQ